VADFQALQHKYEPVVGTIKKFEPYGAKFVGSELVGEQYHLVAQVPSQVVLNRVWDTIKQVDPQYADLKHEITNTGGQDGSYTVQPGDNLSKISNLFYGTPNKYEVIAHANNLADPNKIHSGEALKIPLL
jgi:nucleoid-associated protein YgaU